MGYDYTFPEIMGEAAEGVAVGAAGVVTGILLIAYLLLLGFSVISYVLNAAGMYRIAKRRGIHHAWLAWIPVGCNWLLGSISDHYQYVAKQKQTKRRKILLTLSIILLAVIAVMVAAVVFLVLSADGAAGTVGSILSIALMVISWLGIFGLAIAISVFCYIAYFDLFRSCRPEYDVLFLVLSILFGLPLPFFVFACSGSDKGMPARRAPQPPVQNPYPFAAPAQEPQIPVVQTQIVEDNEE